MWNVSLVLLDSSYKHLEKFDFGIHRTSIVLEWRESVVVCSSLRELDIFLLNDFWAWSRWARRSLRRAKPRRRPNSGELPVRRRPPSRHCTTIIWSPEPRAPWALGFDLNGPERMSVDLSKVKRRVPPLKLIFRIMRWIPESCKYFEWPTSRYTTRIWKISNPMNS